MKIAKVYGIDIKLHLSTLLIIGLVGFYSTSFYLSLVSNASLIELIIVGLSNGLILLFSILIHELSHSIVAQKYGLVVREIELYLFGGVSKIEEEPRTPKSEMIISIVGPLSSLLIGLGLLALFFLPVNLPMVISIIFLYSGISNVGLSLFNLVPAFPIDGGRILRAFLWSRKNDLLSATKIASKVGTIIGYGFIIYGIFQMFTTGLLSGIWLILIGSFMNSAAKQSYLQTKNEMILSSIGVKDILSVPFIGIPFNKDLNLAISEYFIPYKKSYFPVIQNDEIVGLIYFKDIRKIQLWERSKYNVGSLMIRLSEFQYIDDNLSGKEVLKKLNKLTKDPLLLIVEGKDSKEIIGFVGKSDLLSSLEFWSPNVENKHP
ncbi:MAG: site-2 protease family protein [Candidatus Lokiarchaeia archaeon]